MNSPNAQSKEFETQAEMTSSVVWDLLRKIAHSCLNCTNYDPASEGCRLAEGARPPLEIIVKGCEQWDQAIPF